MNDPRWLEEDVFDGTMVELARTERAQVIIQNWGDTAVIDTTDGGCTVRLLAELVAEID